ncbi:prefoldin subunit beta [Sulfurisphaera tokodaii]|uniref:Prefoldin subunit beta n=2 Tax=Sulfurisphaera tokodaii TaxID=111955 RepID=PFDB_SULTO|nr:prefoldin subunit beta [Sulfurisphaera tokodaii]Q975H2.1 RecName: Full=Prefoldin subunit beta; AltName: Full=GimC subunit beta [Sulfurisphaera tokodaii str. 7]BAK54283.1 prefoldin beta subunit [Sulfurisphaera tokodaii str. 7]HII74873.1 prefoldin subunit beta [Sulfurisphaera tokodaii]
MTERIPPELQTQLVKLQQLQDQLNRLLTEKNVIDSELREVNKILQELSQLPAGTTVYKIVGNLLVKTDKETVQKELDDRKEILELRSRTYQKQENLLRTQLEDLQKKVNELLAKYYPQSGGAIKA